MHAELDVQQKEVARRRMRVMQQEARVTRMEAELAEHGVRVTYAETQVAAAEGKRVTDDRQSCAEGGHDGGGVHLRGRV